MNRAWPVFLLLTFFLLTIWSLESGLRSTITAFAEAQAYWTATEAIHGAVLERIAAEAKYTDLIRIDKDNQGKVTLMQANLQQVNRLASEATLTVQETLKNLQKQEIRFPIGQVLGMKLLAAYGPSIKLKLIPVGTVQVKPLESFEGAGINQTRHRIFLNVESSVNVIVPLVKTSVKVETQIPIADTIIVGEVPNFLLGEWLGKSSAYSKTP
ncbi:MAG: sporulation protein YunB [Bacillota bacterium]